MSLSRPKTTQNAKSRINSFDTVIQRLKALTPIKENFTSYKKAYIAYRKQITKTQNIRELISILNDMLAEGLYPDAFIINQVISKLGRYQKVNHAIALYNIAVEKDLLDGMSYPALMDVADKNSDMDLLMETYSNAMEAYSDAKITNHDLTVIRGMVIQVAAKHCEPKIANKIAKIVYQAALRDVTLSSITYVNMIEAMNNKHGDYDLAMEVYQQAIKDYDNNYITDDDVTVIRSCAIKAAGEHGETEVAKRIYQTSLEEGTLSAISYVDMIEAMSKNNDFNSVMKVYHHANRAYYAGDITDNSITIIRSCAFKAAGKHGRLEAANRIYQVALKEKTFNDLLHHVMIDVLVSHNKLKEAKEIYKTCNFKPITPSKVHRHGVYTIDLHRYDFLYGGAYIALNEFMETMNVLPMKMIIIYGKGLHSTRNLGEERDMKKATIQFINDLNLNGKYHASLQEDQANSGRAFCMIRPKLTHEKTRAVTLNHDAQPYSPQFFASVDVNANTSTSSTTSVMNANAMPFVFNQKKS